MEVEQSFGIPRAEGAQADAARRLLRLVNEMVASELEVQSAERRVAPYQRYEERSGRMSLHDLQLAGRALAASADTFKNSLISMAQKIRRGINLAARDFDEHSLVRDAMQEGSETLVSILRGVSGGIRGGFENIQRVYDSLLNRMGLTAVQMAIYDFERSQNYWERLENELVAEIKPRIEDKVVESPREWNRTGLGENNINKIMTYFKSVATEPLYRNAITELIELELLRRGRPERVTGEPLADIANASNIGYVLFQIYASREPNIDEIEFPITPGYSVTTFGPVVQKYLTDQARGMDVDDDVADNPRMRHQAARQEDDIEMAGGRYSKSKRRTSKHTRSIRRKKTHANKRKGKGHKTSRNKRRAKK